MIPNRKPPRPAPLPAALAALAALAASLMLLAGCGDDSSVNAATVLNYNRCQGLDAGLTRVDYAAVAGIRGGALLGATDRDGTEVTQDDDLLLVAISRGRQPTPGYGLTLEEARRDGARVVIRVQWETPQSGAVLPQTLTHPCLVVGLPRNDFERVEAVDQHGKPLGSLEL